MAVFSSKVWVAASCKLWKMRRIMKFLQENDQWNFYFFFLRTICISKLTNPVFETLFCFHFQAFLSTVLKVKRSVPSVSGRNRWVQVICLVRVKKIKIYFQCLWWVVLVRVSDLSGWRETWTYVFSDSNLFNQASSSNKMRFNMLIYCGCFPVQVVLAWVYQAWLAFLWSPFDAFCSLHQRHSSRSLHSQTLVSSLVRGPR